jgi:hypothetical protein
MPAVKPLNNEKVTVQLQDPGQDADFSLIGFSTEIVPAQINVFARLRYRENLNMSKLIACPSAFLGTSLPSRAFLKT